MQSDYARLRGKRGEFIEDLVSRFRPHKWSGVFVVVFEEIMHGLDQLAHAAKDTVSNAPVENLAEEPLDEVEPRRGGGNEVDVQERITRQATS